MEVENEQWKKVEKEKDKREDCERQEKVRKLGVKKDHHIAESEKSV